MNKNYTLKELADIGAVAATKAVLDAVGYEFPKDEEREVFERWYDHASKRFASRSSFEIWKAGREELRQSLEARDAKPDQ